jgi:hypothetical protein
MSQSPGLTHALAIQAFNKADSIIATLDSVARCDDADQCDLFIVQDSWVGSKRTEIYSQAHTDTATAIEAWLTANRSHFRSTSFTQLDRNHGPYATGRRVIDWAFETSEFVIFAEDDVMFEQDAIRWFERVFVHPGFQRADVWAAAGESKFFDARRHVPSPDDIERALDVARRQNLMDRFVYFGFLPSSCFATGRSKWKEFGETRGLANGDRDVNRRCRAEGKVSLWPTIARCRDMGMHHPLGFSVSWRGANHPVFKNNYVVSGMLGPASDELSELADGETAALFDEFIQRWST